MCLCLWRRFSTNEGETWSDFQFSQQDVFVYQLLTEPGEKSTIFTIFGSYADQSHSWLILQVNASDVLGEGGTFPQPRPLFQRVKNAEGFFIPSERSGRYRLGQISNPRAGCVLYTQVCPAPRATTSRGLRLTSEETAASWAASCSSSGAPRTQPASTARTSIDPSACPTAPVRVRTTNGNLPYKCCCGAAKKYLPPPLLCIRHSK